jgi:hypothetical protein
MRRKWWIWVVGTIVVLAATIATVAAFHRSPYAFLDRFHPRIVEVNLARVYSRATPKGSKPLTSFPHTTLLVFQDADSARLLASIKAELTPERGFLSSSLGKQVPSDGAFGTVWQFGTGITSSPGWTGLLKDGAVYADGRIGAVLSEMYGGEANPSVQHTACIVLLTHDETWVEKSLDSVRAFLHLQ